MSPYFSRFLMHWLKVCLIMMQITCYTTLVWSADLSEYHIKAGFLYNFATFTEWPVEVGDTLNLCIYGKDPFASSVDDLQYKVVGNRHLNVIGEINLDRLKNCQILFISRSASADLPQLINKLNSKPVLTVADTPGATRHGVILNMIMKQNRVTFEANLNAARDNGLTISSRLLRLATKVIQ